MQPALLTLLASLAVQLAAPSELELRRGDRICLIGNALAERMQHDGWLEVELQARFPTLELSLRNLGFGADELDVHQRSLNFGKLSADGMESDLEPTRFGVWDRYLDHCDASVVLAFFGYNESFAGAAGLPAFRRSLIDFVEHVRARRYDGEAPPRLVLFSSIPHENLRDPSLPDGAEHNARIQAYNAAIRQVAQAHGLPFVDLYGPMRAAYGSAEEPLTINGIHLSARGNRVLAEVIAAALFPGPPPAASEELRAAVLEKNRLWFQRYRATDGYNIYGGRSRQVYEDATGSGQTFSNFDVLQREMDRLDAMVAERDRGIWAAASGRPFTVDDSGAPPLLAVRTNKPGSGPDGAHELLGGEEALARMSTAPGLRVELFADERDFPELVNPVQMAFDTRGRLWVAVWPTYPRLRPDEPPQDKLLILEDTDGDGRADRCTVFADDLHAPTGFEHWNGGVLVAQVPDLLFLADTDGDGRCDTRERLLHGLDSADTHHSANSFVLGPDGALYFQEGTFHRTQIETIHGPVRNRDGCVWRFEPRTFRVERYVPYDFANPHGHVFDRWGQDFVTDGTGNDNYYALPFSGFLRHPAKHSSYFPFFRQSSRPSAATEILSSAHFPPESQGNYLVANVIGFQGIFQHRLEDDGSGFGAVEVEPVLRSSDPSFRPVDMEIGPDGALYLLDWHNPLIGHLQHHIRDPSRDRSHGRVYRVRHEERELLRPAAVAGEPIEALLELLKSPDDRLRYRVRIELSARDSDQVTRRTKEWAASLDPSDPDHEHHLLEALWLHQQHDRMDEELLLSLLEARDPRARAAATRVARHGRFHLPNALELLHLSAGDEHPRVRLEAVVAASHLDSPGALAVVLEALRHPTDRFLDYALRATLRALEAHVPGALRADSLAADNPAALAFLREHLDAPELATAPLEELLAEERAALEASDGSLVLIRTVPHQMLYDVESFWVAAGSPVRIVFRNDDLMPHNLVVTAPGAMEAVGQAAEALAAQEGGEELQHVPEHGGVLWATRLVLPGELERLDFVAPAEPGEYPFVCTYPGHWRVMNGTMHVVAALPEGPRVTRRAAGGPAAAARAFVRDWKPADLEAHFAEGWRRGRSLGRGAALFAEAGCVTCHVHCDEGPVAGPELARLAARHRGAELLRHVLLPSEEVLPEYVLHGFELDDGTLATGRILEETEEEVTIAPTLLEPGRTERLRQEWITARWESELSPMPSGLLVTLEPGEILDLLAYVEDAAERAATEPEEDRWVTYPGGDGPGAGRSIVLLAGDDEYRSEQALPMLARILSERHGFRCTVLFAQDPETGEIEPGQRHHMPGLHLLGDADLVIPYLRFREWPDEDMRHFAAFVEAGKPIVGIRTATHAFRYEDRSSPYAERYDFRGSEWEGGFGRRFLGETWIAHHGRHGVQSTRGVPAPGQEEVHPILRGVGDVWGPTNVYAITTLPGDAVALLHGLVLADRSPTSTPVTGPLNDPPMPLVWTRELPRPDGPPQRIVCSTIGSAEDLQSEDLRRLLVNATYWALRMEERIPERSEVEPLVPYRPTPSGFGNHLRGLRPSDHARDRD